MINRYDLAELDYGITMGINALITALGMHAENQKRLSNDESPAYTEDDFNKLIEEKGIHHNAVISRWFPT